MDKKVEPEDIVSLAKRRGFIFAGSDIYGGLAGTWDYGPLGVTLKKNIMDLWWKIFVEDRDDMVGVDSAILMNQKVWQASGHVNTFTDPLVECSNCKGRFREDKIDRAKCPSCGATESFGEARQFNMMFKTLAGPNWVNVEHENTVALEGRIDFLDKNDSPSPSLNIEKRNDVNSVSLYDRNSSVFLRPETAQGIFTNFKNVVDTLYPDIPFGIAQQGKAFRNEISPRDFVFRSREFNQMEIEYFVHESNWEPEFEKWRTNITDFLTSAGVNPEHVHELEVPENDLAHYSKRTIDYEFDYPHGKDELLGLAYRTSFDLDNIERGSGKNMKYQPKDGSVPFVPHVIEPSFGVERLLMAVLVSAYSRDEQNGETRVFLKLPEHIAPVRYCVSPLLKNKPELVGRAREVYDTLKAKYGAVMWDDNGNIGKRYRRQDEIGTPWCVVVDFDSLEDGTVTLRNRDNLEQTRVKPEEI